MENDKVRLYKKYQNRKMYGMEEKAYVTLNELAMTIRSGAKVKVINNKTKEDITAQTMLTIVFKFQENSIYHCSEIYPSKVFSDIIKGKDCLLTNYLADLKENKEVIPQRLLN